MSAAFLAEDDYPNYTWDGLTLNLFCSITFIVKVTHKQQHRFTFQQNTVDWQLLQQSKFNVVHVYLESKCYH